MKLLVLCLAVICSLGWPEEILMMDTSEFSYIDHPSAKRTYLTKLSESLRRLRIKIAGFDAFKSDAQDLYERIHTVSAWVPIEKAVEVACKKAENRNNCQALAQTRIDTLEFIEAHPREPAAEN